MTEVKSVTLTGDAEETGLSNLASRSLTGQTVYWDPMGFKSDGGVNLREKIYEEQWQDKYEAINQNMSDGQSLKSAVKSALDTNDVSMPVWTSPDIFISDKQSLPLKDTIPRVAVEETEIKLDEVSEVGEPTSSTDEVATVSQVDDTVDKYTYNIENVYVKKEVSDTLIVTGRYDAPRLQTQTGAMGIERYLEKQAIYGTNYDANGMEGLADWVPTANVIDGTDKTINADLFRELKLELDKVSAQSPFIVTDFQTVADLKSSLDDHIRVVDPQVESYNFGSEAISFEGVLVAPSHGVEETAGRDIFGFDASGFGWYYLADTSVKYDQIVQTNDTTEEMAIYEKVVFGSEARNTIVQVDNVGETSA